MGCVVISTKRHRQGKMHEFPRNQLKEARKGFSAGLLELLSSIVKLTYLGGLPRSCFFFCFIAFIGKNIKIDLVDFFHPLAGVFIHNTSSTK